MEKKQQDNSEHSADNSQKQQIKRRTLLKALVGLPVLGAFGFELYKKMLYDNEKKNRIIHELGLDDLQSQFKSISSSGSKTDLVRIGIIGFGSRATEHANGLGYIHPLDVEVMKKNNTLNDWLLQEDLKRIMQEDA